jgi:nitrate/TMAO reductase-like tetraheme cytochrome c subunit
MQAYPKRAAQRTEYQTDLHASKEKILARAKSLNCTIYNWNYDQMATKARSMVERLHQFLGSVLNLLMWQEKVPIL